MKKRIEQTLTSIEVAEMVEKTHKHLMRDIRTYVDQLNQSKIGPVEFFQESTYKDSKGEKRPCYNITKKGCEFIAHKLTGVKGTAFTARYINRFHEMEEIIENGEQPQENQSCTPTTKLYKGVPVVTVKDVVNQIGLSRGVIRTALKHGILNKDYWLLKGAELFRFKTIYPEFKTAKSLYVIAESGVKKLCKFLEVQSFPLIPKERAVPAVNPAEKLTKVSKEEDYGIKYPLEVLHKLMNISKERGLDLTLRPFKACYSVLYRDTVGIQETLPIHQIIYEIAFELAHSLLHKGRHVVGNQDCNKRAHQTAVSFIKTLDVLSTQ